MRWSLGIAIAGCLTLAGAPSHGATLSSATLSVTLLEQDFLFPGPGATGSATSALGATLGGGIAFAGTDSVIFPSPTKANSPIDKILAFITSNAAGTFAGVTPGQVGGVATFIGKAYLYATPYASGSQFLTVPIRVGKATSFTERGSGLSFSIFGAPWTAGQATITGLTGQDTPGGGANGTTVMVTGSNALSPGGAGTLTLVSPGKVLVSTGNKLAIIGTLTLTYVPEPRTLLLLAGGALALGALGRLRSSPRRQ